MLKIVVLSLAVVILGAAGYFFYLNYTSQKQPATDSVSSLPVETESPRLSDDPAYKEVIDKYHLTEEQLQILSTVDSSDN